MREVIRGAITGAEPVSIVEAKASARIETDIEDLLVYGFIRTAREEAEAYTRRALTIAREIDDARLNDGCRHKRR